MWTLFSLTLPPPIGTYYDHGHPIMANPRISAMKDDINLKFLRCNIELI